MKRIILTSVLLLMGVMGEAMAACADNATICYTQVTNLPTFLPDKTVCDGSPGNWKGQEWHSKSSGLAKNLIDYKHGPSSTNDPTAPVGEWSISGDTVTYGYYKETNSPGAGTVPYSYKVWNKGDGTYDFCNGGALVTNVTIQTGQGACTGSHVPIVACSASAASPARILSTAAEIVSPTKANDIQDKQDEPIVSPTKESDKQGKQAKPIAFPGPILPPTKGSNKQGEKDKSIVPPAKEGNKQGEKDKSIVPPVKEGGKQGKKDKLIVSPAKEGDKQGEKDKLIVPPAKKGDKQGN